MSGSLIVIDENGVIPEGDYTKMPGTEKDIFKFINDRKMLIHSAYIEKVHSMPKQGVASSFKFGMGYGGLRMAILACDIRMIEVTPNKWQSKMGCRTGGDKNISKAKAQQLFPGIKVTHALADGLLIAEYARREEERLW